MPTAERMQADLLFIGRLKRGEIEAVLAGSNNYRRLTVAEMRGRALATILGVAQALKQDGVRLEGAQDGDHAQSSAMPMSCSRR